MGPTGEMTVTSNLPKGIGNILQRRPGGVKRGTKESGQCPQGMRVPRERVGDVVLIHYLQAASYLDVLLAHLFRYSDPASVAERDRLRGPGRERAGANQPPRPRVQDGSQDNEFIIKPQQPVGPRPRDHVIRIAWPSGTLSRRVVASVWAGVPDPSRRASLSML